MEVIKQLIPEERWNLKCPYQMKPEFVVVHNTANDASARNEISFMSTNDDATSFHYAVDDIEAVQGLKILASSEEAGVYAVMNKNGHHIFITGHSEYDPLTLKAEYDRDKGLGLDIKVPKNYFPNDDDTKDPVVRWRSSANLLFSNWLNYFVYQTTPYDIMSIGE